MTSYKALKKALETLYAQSIPLDDADVVPALEEYKELCQFNGVKPLEVRVLEYFPGSHTYDAVHNCIYTGAWKINELKEKNRLDMLVPGWLHETAHGLLGHEQTQLKKSEFIVDRIAAAMMRGDKERYSEFLDNLNSLAEIERGMRAEVLANATGIKKWVYKLGFEKMEKREQKHYGTHTERLANLKLENPHSGYTKER
jgi:hypothetical protein